MIEKLKHRFWTANTPEQGFWAENVFKDVYSLQKLENNLQKIAFPNNPDDLNGHDPLSKVLGDGWEGFGEIFFMIFGIHPNVRVTDLEVSPPNQIGFDYNYKHTSDFSIGTIQAKYIGKSEAWAKELKESETMKLERFQNASYNVGGVSVELTDNMIVFTNAKDIHYFTSEVLLYNKVRCIGRKQIKYLTDKNPAFWDTARKMISNTNTHIGF